MKQPFIPFGVIPACLMPIDDNGTPDHACYRRHLGDLAAITDLGGIVVNGHAAEVHGLSEAQQIWGIETACAEVAGKIPVIAGIYSESTNFACHMARQASQIGVDALLIFPPNSLMFGGNARPELGVDFVKAIAGTTSLPLIVFQYPLTTHLSYDLDILVTLCDEVNTIVAIKDLGSDPRLHERTITALHGLSRPVHVLSSHSQWLGASLTMGAKGIISGAGSVIADRQRALFEAFTTQTANLTQQRHLMAEMSLLVEAFYAPPYVNWQARMKRLLHHFGRFSTPNVLPPLQKISSDDWHRMVKILEQTTLSPQTIYQK